jgi:hypothetical protein
MKIGIAHKLDYLANSSKLNENKIWELVDDLFHNDKDLIDTINYFISNLSPEHQVPGKDFEKLVSIAQWVDENQTSTQKQKRAVGIILGLNWNHIDPVKNPSMYF